MSGENEDDIIRNYLSELQDELSVSFADRKKQMGVQENIEDEIMTLIEEINNKEDQLKQVVDLTTIVLNKKMEYEQVKQQEMENMEQALVHMETELEIQKQTANQYQRLYQDCLDKNNDLQNALQHVEEQLSSKNNQHSIMKSELLNLKQMEMQVASVEEQKQLLIKLQKELKHMEEENSQYKSELKDLRSQQKDILQNYKISFEGLQKQQYENKNLRQSMVKLENKLQDNKISIDQYQEMIQIQKQEIETLSQKYMDLQDEINSLTHQNKEQEKQLIENQSMLGKTISGNDRNPSYFSHFSEVDMKERQFEENHSTLDNNVIKKKKTSSRKSQKLTQDEEEKQEEKSQKIKVTKPSSSTSSNNLEELKEKKKKQKQKSDKVKQVIKNLKNSKQPTSKKEDKFQKYKVPPPIKRDPYEEFFELIIQAAKLNSPHMDDVLGINTKNWYQQAIGELVPFHKWYNWVNDKLHGIRNELIKSREKSLLYSKRVIVF